MVVAAPSVYPAETRRPPVRRSHGSRVLRNHVLTHDRDEHVGSFLLYAGVVQGFRNLTLFFSDQLYDDWLWRRGAAAKVALAGCDRRNLRCFALRHVHRVHFCGYECADSIPLTAESETVRSNSYQQSITRLGSHAMRVVRRVSDE